MFEIEGLALTDVDGRVGGDDGEDCACDELPEGAPCWPCYRDGATFDD